MALSRVSAALAILLVAVRARGDASVPAAPPRADEPGWAQRCAARFERARAEAARRDPAFAGAVVRFAEEEALAGCVFLHEEGPLVELSHGAYQAALAHEDPWPAWPCMMEAFAYRVLVSQMSAEALAYHVLVRQKSAEAYPDGSWHPEDGSQVKYLHGFKGKLELTAPTFRQRNIINSVLRPAVEDCLRMTQARNVR
jgi:hypothetical protein